MLGLYFFKNYIFFDWGKAYITLLRGIGHQHWTPSRQVWIWLKVVLNVIRLALIRVGLHRFYNILSLQIAPAAVWIVVFNPKRTS